MFHELSWRFMNFFSWVGVKLFFFSFFPCRTSSTKQYTADALKWQNIIFISFQTAEVCHKHPFSKPRFYYIRLFCGFWNPLQMVWSSWQLTSIHLFESGLSYRAGGGGFLPAMRVWCAGYEVRMKADIKHELFDLLVRTRLSTSVQPPIANFPDNPVFVGFLSW